MARTTVSAVQATLQGGGDYDGFTPLQVYVETASALVDDVVECAAAQGKTLSAGRLELIERWLAAYAYKVSDKPYSSKSTDRASANFDGKTGMYLEANHYGQMAVLLDTSGCLDELTTGESAGPLVAGLTWLGKPPSSQTDYVDRD